MIFTQKVGGCIISRRKLRLFRQNRRWLILPLGIAGLVGLGYIGLLIMGMFPAPLPFLEVYHAELRAELVEGQPMTFRFIAEISGGLNNAPGLFCLPRRWMFGDGHGVTEMPMCRAWGLRSRIPRTLEPFAGPHGPHIYPHIYEEPGSYEVSFSYGWLKAAPILVEVSQ